MLEVGSRVRVKVSVSLKGTRGKTGVVDQVIRYDIGDAVWVILNRPIELVHPTFGQVHLVRIPRFCFSPDELELL